MGKVGCDTWEKWVGGWRNKIPARCAVLPPGAAQRSSTTPPHGGRARRATACAPGSCTVHSPSLNPGSRRGSPPPLTRSAPGSGGAGSTLAPAASSFSRTASRVERRRFTRRASRGVFWQEAAHAESAASEGSDEDTSARRYSGREHRMESACQEAKNMREHAHAESRNKE